MTDVTAATEVEDELMLELRDRKTGAVEPLACDVVLLGTGFERAMPAAVRTLAGRLGLDTVEVSRQYRLELPGEPDAACYLQGVNEATHGIADSLLSVLSHRAAEIAADICSHRAALRDRDPSASTSLAA
jgi:L-ornithine N5-oxygenase